jgi:hypothetical protein
MPRYYFHLTDGKQVLDNHKGIDLPGNAAACTDAVALARDLKQGARIFTVDLIWQRAPLLIT